MKLFIFLVLVAPSCKSISDWRPILQPDLYPGLKGRFPSEPNFPSLPSLVAQSYQQPSPGGGGQCELYKVGFLQDLYFQYIQYKATLPEMKEFTLCYWSKFHNHTNDHPIFSYAVDGQPRAIFVWVSNTERSSYFSLAVEGHTFYRLNYPLRLNRWYHTCQSWNGKTGEWQIWVNAERVGRGFHNRLVGHHIPSGGIAITGQEQTQYGGGFLEGELAPKGAGGMLGEITMVQFYRVALTAGKAHRDHKHHHAHEFDHNGVPITTTPPPPRPLRPMTPTHPLLTGGQLNPNIALTIASGQTQQFTPTFVPGQNFNAQLLNGQFVNSFVSQQLMNTPQFRGPQQFIPQDGQQGQLLGQQPQQLQQLQQLQGLSPLPIAQNTQLGRPATLINNGLMLPSLLNPANVAILDTRLETHQLFKRDNKNGTTADESNKNTTAEELHIEVVEDEEGLNKNDTMEDWPLKNNTKDVEPNKDKKKPASKDKDHSKLEAKSKPSIDPVESSNDSVEKKHTKRELILQGGIVTDDAGFDNVFDQSLLSGLAGIGQNQPILQLQKQYEEREPAEAEVTAVMNVCSGCDEEPFGKALVFGWRGVPKKLYSGAFYTPATPRCKAF